ncbi:hypothetical protein [Rhizobium leguminosarum]|uniref:hypothetical protein n=1 Tax=Rhizobium leguminosarum TaxID=384 RepID=UPI001C9706AD|nr:hypothetical protein [Rhizobium leguminosarum]MBW8790672.1 hypothetical protein [Rhizobium leguminosarum]MBY5368590.1 hypothetical protein [Rhizobium leguminosarum]
MLKPEATLRRRQVKTRCNMWSSPIDLQIVQQMQTACQPQTRKSSSEVDKVAACMAISSASRSFFRQSLACPGPRMAFFVQRRNRLELA